MKKGTGYYCHYSSYPVCKRVIDFIIALATNITGIHIYCGEIEELLQAYHFPQVYSKLHPAFLHYPGIKDEPEWMFPVDVNKGQSFMAFWKKCTKHNNDHKM